MRLSLYLIRWYTQNMARITMNRQIRELRGMSRGALINLNLKFKKKKTRIHLTLKIAER